ncbi:MAG: T9SS type A sorting domain-containing protein [Ginsengibacter sp.]
MNFKSTLVGKCNFVLITLIIFSIFSANGQSLSPKLRFVQPKLISGIDGQKHATYKFSNVVEGIDAYIEIADLKNGARLVNIDDSTLGYYDAWQPTIGGPSTYGTSCIKWEITFKTALNVDYTFPLLDLSAVDIDGDNVRVREFIDMEKASSYDLPTIVPSLLTISNVDEDDDTNENEGTNVTGLRVLGPILNRTNIDTTSLDVRINFHFINISKIKLSLGSQIDNNGTSGSIATDRYNSLYFKSISNIVNTLGVKYRSFEAYALNSSSVNISWATESETNNDHFEIERSFDQKDFSTAALIFGPEANTGLNKYSFVDKVKGLSDHKVVYYRLKQIDIDGQVTYSAVKMVRFNSASKVFMKVYPNPYVSKINIKFYNDGGSKAQLRLVNATGQVVCANESRISKGDNEMELKNISSNPSGLYIVDLIVDGNLITSQKVFKQ